MEAVMASLFTVVSVIFTHTTKMPVAYMTEVWRGEHTLTVLLNAVTHTSLLCWQLVH